MRTKDKITFMWVLVFIAIIVLFFGILSIFEFQIRGDITSKVWIIFILISSLTLGLSLGTIIKLTKRSRIQLVHTLEWSFVSWVKTLILLLSKIDKFTPNNNEKEGVIIEALKILYILSRYNMIGREKEAEMIRSAKDTYEESGIFPTTRSTLKELISLLQHLNKS